MTECPDGLGASELAEQTGSVLPPREQMSLIAPGSSALTPAADAVPVEAQEWHGDPDEVHIL